MAPNAELVLIAVGIPKFVWLVTLKNSDRNCSENRSPMVKVLSAEKSHCSRPGARNAFRARSPNGSLAAGVAKVYPAK